jgi:hypothetical protein
MVRQQIVVVRPRSRSLAWRPVLRLDSLGPTIDKTVLHRSSRSHSLPVAGAPSGAYRWSNTRISESSWSRSTGLVT